MITMDPKPHFISPMQAFAERQRGFGLIELMISIVIGLLIVAALTTLFVNTTRTNSEMAKANSLIENGRFAMQLLEADIVHAGFWGTHVPQFDDQTFTTVPADTPSILITDPDAINPCKPSNEWVGINTAIAIQYKNNLIGIPVQSYEIVSPVPSPTLSACASIVTNPKANTDVLVVRHAETCVPGIGNCEAYSSGKLYFQSDLCLATASYVLDAAGFSLQLRNCATAAEIRKFISNIYYIRDYAVTTGDGIPTLMRSQFDLSGGSLAHQGAVALIEGIEGFRVEFGIDTLSKTGAAIDYTAAINWQDPATKTTPTNRGDGIPEGDFVRCTTASPCTEAQLTNVAAAKLYVLARSRETTPGYTDTKTYTLGSTTLGPFNDNYKRHVFSTAVRLPNISSRRESP